MRMSETADLMNSRNYKERFVAEYWQTKIRYEALKKTNTKIEACETILSSCDSAITPEMKDEARNDMPRHVSPLSVLKAQERVMEQYLRVLELRADIELINLEPMEKTRDDELRNKNPREEKRHDRKDYKRDLSNARK